MKTFLLTLLSKLIFNPYMMALVLLVNIEMAIIEFFNDRYWLSLVNISAFLCQMVNVRSILFDKRIDYYYNTIMAVKLKHDR